MNTNGKGLDFAGSVEHNIAWIKRLAEEHDVSQGLAAHGALMTMTMMDHHYIKQMIDKMRADLDEILCQLNSSPIIIKPSPQTEELTSIECSISPLITATSSTPEKSN